jgi:hypothetical protein
MLSDGEHTAINAILMVNESRVSRLPFFSKPKRR